MWIRMLQLQNEKYFVFQKVHLILFCLFVPKMKKFVTKYKLVRVQRLGVDTIKYHTWVTNSQLDTTDKRSALPSRWPQGTYKQTHTKVEQTQERKNIKDPHKKYRLGTVSKIFYWRA